MNKDITDFSPIIAILNNNIEFLIIIIISKNKVLINNLFSKYHYFELP